ncbi:MAG: hypothetical protein WCR04_00245 [Fibrobacteraceae bacterium]
MQYFQKFSTPEKEILIGNALMSFTSIFYILWWNSSFYTPDSGALFIMLALFCGMSSIGFLATGSFSMPTERGSPESIIILASIFLYIILLFTTTHVFARPLTSELFIIIIWLATEVSAVNALYGYKCFTTAAAIISYLIITCATVIGLICYVRYYTFSPQSIERLAYGIYPLAADGIAVFLIFILQLLSKQK